MPAAERRSACIWVGAALLLSVGIALLSGCDAGPQPCASAAATAPHAAELPLSIAGRWAITRFDGERPTDEGGAADRRAPSLTIAAAAYGATAGCNALGGIATIDAERFYTRSGPQTVMLCSPALMRQEEILDAVLRASPRISAQGSRLMLSGGGHTLLLERISESDRSADAAVPNLAGMRFTIDQVDGVFLAPATPRGQARPLVFAANAWRATPACATLAGTWRQEGWRLRTEATRIATPCPHTEDASLDDTVRAVLEADPAFALDPTGGFIMAGGGHWLSGVRDLQPDAASHDRR